MQETLNELWENWAKSEQEEGVAVVDRSLVPPVANALIFRFQVKKTIGVKDLESALNSIWRTCEPVNIFAIGEGIYLASFANASDCNRVLAKQL